MEEIQFFQKQGIYVGQMFQGSQTISVVGRLKWPPLSLEDCLEWWTLEKRPLEDSDPWRWKEESPDRIELCREC